MAGSNTVQLITELRDRLTGPLQRQAAGLNDWQRRALAVGAAAVTTAAAVARATTAFIRFADRVTQQPAALNDLAEGLQIAQSEYAALSYVVQQAGGEASGLPMIFQRIRVSVAESADASSAAGQALNRLNLSYDDLRDAAPDEQFRQIVGALSVYAGTAEQAELAQALLGRGAVSLRGTMSLTRTEIKSAEDAARELGVVMGDDAYAAADRFQDGMATIKARLNSMQVEALEPILPDIIALLDELIDFGKDVLPDVIDALGDGIGVLKDFAEALGWIQDAFHSLPLSGAVTDIERNITGWEKLADVALPGTGRALSLVRQGIDALSPSEETAAQGGDVLVSALNRVADAAQAATTEAEGYEDQLDTLAERILQITENKKNAAWARTQADGLESMSSAAADAEKSLSGLATREQELKAAELADIEAGEAQRKAHIAERLQLEVDAIHEAANERKAAQQTEDAARQASIERGIQWTANFGTSMIMAANDGQSAWDSFWSRFMNQVIAAAFSEAFQALLKFLVPESGLLGGIFGSLFSTGGTVGGPARAASGLVVGGSGYGDRVPALLTPGETVLTRDESRVYHGGQRPVSVSITTGSMLSTGSRAEAQRAGKAVVDLIEDYLGRDI